MAKKGQIEVKVNVNDDEAKKKLKGFGETTKEGLLSVGNAVKGFFAGAVVAAIAAAGKAIVEFAQEADKFKGVADSFKKMTTAMGQDADQMLSKMREGVKGTVSDLELMTSANEAMMRGLDMTKVDEMMRIAMAASKATGISTQETTKMILNGLAEQKANMLENVGITFDAVKANEAYAATIGKTADQLTVAEQKQAFLSEALKVGGAMADVVGSSKFLTFNQIVQKSAASMENLKAKIGQAALPALTSLANVFDRLIDNIGGDGLQVNEMKSGFDSLGKAVAYIGGIVLGTIGDMVKGFKALTASIIASGKAAKEFAQAGIAALGRDFDKAEEHIKNANSALVEGNKANKDLLNAVASLGAVHQKGAKAVDEYTAALAEQRAEQDKVAASAGKMGSELDKAAQKGGKKPEGSKFEGFDIQKEAGGKIDQAAGMAEGFGGAALGGGMDIINQAVQMQQAIGQAELEQMQNRHEQYAWFNDVIVQIQAAAWEARLEELRRQQEEELTVLNEGHTRQQEALLAAGQRDLEITNELFAQGEISKAEKDQRDRVAAQKKAQDEKALATRQNKEKLELQKRQNMEMEKLEKDKAAAEKAAKKQTALITWLMASAQLEANKRLSTSQIQVQAALGAMSAIAQSVAMMGPFGLAVGLPIAAMIRAQAMSQIATVNSQIALPPAELFLAEGGIVQGSPKGTLAVIGENNRKEAVIPLDGPNAPGGMGNQIILNVQNLYATDDLPDILVDKIDEALRRRAITGRSVFAAEVGG